ncbi:MAG: hypothetical protein MJZ81_07650 [Bacteroidales bacterium]|nr:hypothetical protein [Bacteroidales bacterium]
MCVDGDGPQRRKQRKYTMNNLEITNWANEILKSAGINTKNEKARVDQVNSALAVIDTMPEEIADLMRTTIENCVKQVIKADERIGQLWDEDTADRKQVHEEGYAKLKAGDEEGARALWKFERSMGDAAYTVEHGYRTFRTVTSRDEVVEKYGAERVARWEELATLYRIVGCSGRAHEEGYAKTLKKVAICMKDIANDLTFKLEGVPEGCETDAHWGVGGYFNAIIFRGEKRVSFKSFLAGGWNIQRLHIRVRATLLK